MSALEVLIRCVDSDSWDTRWRPEKLADIVTYCAEHGATNPNVALYTLLKKVNQPALWALAILDIEANFIPQLHDMYFTYQDMQKNKAIIVIQAVVGEGGKAEMAELIKQGQQAASQLAGYDITAGEPTDIEKHFGGKENTEKMRKLHGYLDDFDHPNDGQYRIFAISFQIIFKPMC